MSVDSFAYVPETAPGNMVVGAVISEGSQKQSDLTDEYYDRLTAAFGIVQSIALKSAK